MLGGRRTDRRRSSFFALSAAWIENHRSAESVAAQWTSAHANGLRHKEKKKKT